MNDGARLSNRLGWILTGICALLLIVGFMLGRSSAPAAQASPSQLSGVAGWPGARRMDGDVPVGYAHTPAGAVAAATNYSQALEPFWLNPPRYRAALQAIAVPSEREQMLAQADVEFGNVENDTGAMSNAAKGVREALVTVPLSYHVQAYTSSRAVVEIWSVSVIAEDKVLGPTQTWADQTVVLKWVGDDWRESVETTVNTGAIPHLGQTPSLDASLPPELGSFQRYRHAG
jgi:hypothetical protein